MNAAWEPSNLLYSYSNPIADITLIDSANAGCGVILRCHKDGVIDSIGCGPNVITGTIANIMEARIEGVTAGLPDGTLFGGSGPEVFTPDVWKWVTLASPATVLRNNNIACIVKGNASSPPDASNNVTVYSSINVTKAPMSPHPIENTGSGWAATSTRMPTIVARYSDGEVVSGCLGIALQYGYIRIFGTDTSPNEYGNSFTPASSCDLYGVKANIRADSQQSDFEIAVYDGTSLIEAMTFVASQISPFITNGDVNAVFQSPIRLTAGKTYTIGVRPTTVNTIRMNGLVYGDQAVRESISGSVFGVSRDYAGAWTNDVNAIYQVYPVLGPLVSGGTSGVVRAAGFTNMRG